MSSNCSRAVFQICVKCWLARENSSSNLFLLKKTAYKFNNANTKCKIKISIPLCKKEKSWYFYWVKEQHCRRGSVLYAEDLAGINIGKVFSVAPRARLELVSLKRFQTITHKFWTCTSQIYATYQADNTGQRPVSKPLVSYHVDQFHTAARTDFCQFGW